MRHETRDSTDLYFTLEVILGGAGQTSFMIGSSPTVSIYSVSLDAYWSDGSGAFPTGWVQIPGTVNPPGLGTGLLHDMLDHHHHASGTPPAAANECLLPGLFYFDANNTTGPFPGQDIWTTDPGSGSQGYILCFKEPANNILEYAHIALLTNSTINANVVDWGGVAANISVGGDTDLPAITVAGWSDPDVGSDGLVSGLINIVGGAGTHKAVPNTNVSYYAQANPLNGGTPAAMASGLGGQPDVNVLGWGNNLLGGTAADISMSTAYAQGAITVKDISPVSVLDIDGITFTQGVEYVAGVDIFDTVINLQAAIGASAAPVISEVVEGVRILLTHTDSGAAGNLVVLASTAADIEVSGSGTLAGGSENNLPNINVEMYKDKLVKSSVKGMPDVNVMDWDGHTTIERHANIETQDGAGGDQLPAITVSGWGNDPSVSLSIGTDTFLPSISVRGWHDSESGEDGVVFGKIDTSGGGTKHEVFPSINVYDWNGANTGGGPEAWETSANDGSVRATLNVGTVGGLPKICVTAWDDPNGGSNADGSLISVGVAVDTLVSWTADNNPDTLIFASRPNVRTQIVADNAIDEEAIKIDSVTYEEISTSAAQEISDAVWNADIFNSIYHPDPADPTRSYAKEMTIGRAMLVQYLSQNVNHWGTNSESPMHICNVDDGSGNKFYSSRLATWPLTSDEIISYIDRTIIIVKGLTFNNAPGGEVAFNETAESYLGRITGVGSDGSGQYFEIKLVDEDESSVPHGLASGSDILIVKAETDATMHEIAHEVWEESVFDHETADTFGMFSRIMTGLTQFNHRITDSLYDDSGRLLSCRLVVYPSSEDAKNETNALTTVEVTSTYDEKQNMETFLAKEE
jgi:hypothetical protein